MRLNVPVALPPAAALSEMFIVFATTSELRAVHREGSGDASARSWSDDLRHFDCLGIDRAAPILKTPVTPVGTFATISPTANVLTKAFTVPPMKSAVPEVRILLPWPVTLIKKGVRLVPPELPLIVTVGFVSPEANCKSVVVRLTDAEGARGENIALTHVKGYDAGSSGVALGADRGAGRGDQVRRRHVHRDIASGGRIRLYADNKWRGGGL